MTNFVTELKIKKKKITQKKIRIKTKVSLDWTRINDCPSEISV